MKDIVTVDSFRMSTLTRSTINCD